MAFLNFLPDRPDWFGRAVCATADPALFTPDTETELRLYRVRTGWCEHCPVIAQCLTHALEFAEVGFWGGTSTQERDRIRRRRTRVKCPDCGGLAPYLLFEQLPDGTLDPHQVCLSCGLSWKAAFQEALAEAGAV